MFCPRGASLPTGLAGACGEELRLVVKFVWDEIRKLLFLMHFVERVRTLRNSVRNLLLPGDIVAPADVAQLVEQRLGKA